MGVCPFSNVSHYSQTQISNILRVHEKGTQIMMSECGQGCTLAWGQFTTLSVNAGKTLPQSHVLVKESSRFDLVLYSALRPPGSGVVQQTGEQTPLLWAQAVRYILLTLNSYFTGIHAREWISPASVTYIINELTENRDAHGEPVKYVDWYILPVMNPDGYEYSHRVDRLWRKNRHIDGRRTGTDLNRNFGYKWGGEGSSREPCRETFAGSHSFSEPESAAVSSFIQSQAGSLKV